jgi:DNA polymerase-3 subunit beta
MKAICDRAALLDAVSLVGSVVAARSPRPQLSCVKVEASRDDHSGVRLTATDAEVSLSLRLDRVEVEQAGESLVPADKLVQIIRAEDAEPTLTISAEGDTTHIVGEDAHFQLRGFPPGDFAEIRALAAFGDTSGAYAFLEHRAGGLADLVRRTLFAAARENSRYAINGVLLKRSQKRLEMVATDGRRLALCRTSISGEGDDISCIVPSKALNLLQKLVEDPEEPVAIAVGQSQIVFGFGGAEAPRAVLASNLVEGSFPPYEDVIPKDQHIKAGFEREALASAVKRAALLTNEESRGVRMAFDASERRLQLSSRVPEMGEATIGLEIASFEGEDIEVGFNPQFITDALRVIDEGTVTFELKGSNKPGLLRAGSDFSYVVMPVALQ